MLRPDVVEAVRRGTFHIWAVSTVDEGIEILTGIEAGVPGEDGEYPDGTVHRLVDLELQRLAKGLKEFSAPAEKGDGGPEGPK